MPNRIRVALITALTVISSVLAVGSAGAAVTPQKVVIIVGPTGAQTDNYRSKGDTIAATAEAAGATVVKVYSPNATWANVRAAVNGANIVVYLGHGNGSPNPYGTTELTDRANGWGLNRTTSGGDGDNWGSTMVYCGEKALMGTLTSGSAAQWAFCGGSTNTDGITPAPNWVMIYSNACYTPGASEGWDTPATESVAFQRVRNYSYPSLSIGGGAYFATDMHQGSAALVDSILRNPTLPFGAIAEAANGYDLSRQVHFAHPDLSGTRIWIQNTGSATSGDYFLAYAGKPGLTPSGSTVAYTEPTPSTPPGLVARTPGPGANAVGLSPAVTARFNEPVTGVSTGTMVLSKTSDYVAIGANVSYDASTLTATLQPSAPLQPNTTYRLGMSGSIKDLGGNPLPWTWWTFKTLSYDPPVMVNVRIGTHTGYQLSSSGAMTASKSYTLTKNSGASTNTRTALTNQSGTWFYINTGVWAGYWLRESDVISLASAPASAPPPPNAAFNPVAGVTFRVGTHTGYQFSGTGAMTAQKSFTLSKNSGATSSARRMVINQSGTWFYITGGVWGGYWVRASDVIYLTP